MSKELLERSIKAWEAKLKAKKWTDFELGVDECPLCVEYFKLYCLGCPVRERTGERGCSGSPYDEVLHAKKADYERRISGEGRAAIRAEVDFLKSLRVPS